MILPQFLATLPNGGNDPPVLCWIFRGIKSIFLAIKGRDYSAPFFPITVLICQLFCPQKLWCYHVTVASLLPLYICCEPSSKDPLQFHKLTSHYKIYLSRMYTGCRFF